MLEETVPGLEGDGEPDGVTLGDTVLPGTDTLGVLVPDGELVGVGELVGEGVGFEVGTTVGITLGVGVGVGVGATFKRMNFIQSA
jgi:hypothetical protein